MVKVTGIDIPASSSHYPNYNPCNTCRNTLKKNKKNLQVHLRLHRPSVSLLNVKIHDYKMRKILMNYGLFGCVANMAALLKFSILPWRKKEKLCKSSGTICHPTTRKEVERFLSKIATFGENQVLYCQVQSTVVDGWWFGLIFLSSQLRICP